MSPRKSLSPEMRKGYSGKKISIFCKNLQKRRLELGMRQEDLAQALSIPRQRISEMESGRFPADPERIVALSSILKCDIRWLIGVENAPNPTEHMISEHAEWIEMLIDDAEKRFGRKNAVNADGKKVMRFFITNLRLLIKEWKNPPTFTPI